MNRLLNGSLLISRRAFSAATKPASEVFQGAYLNRDVVTSRVINIVKTVDENPSVNANTYFVPDLGYDSLQRKVLNERLAGEFCVIVPKEVEDGFISVKAAVDYFSSHPKAR